MVNSKEMDVNLAKISTNQLTGLDVSIDNLNYRINGDEVKLTGLHIKNKENPAVFSSKQKYRSPWLDVDVEEIRIGLNIWKIYNKGVLIIENIAIHGAKATIYNDVTLPLSPPHKPMPSRAIRDIPFPITIDSLNIYNSHLIYKHKMKADKPGIFELTDIEVKGSNITNIDYLIDLNASLTLNISAILWNSGKLKADVDIDLENQLDYTIIEGSLTNMPLKKAENMVKPLFGVDVASGYINNFSYNLTMNENIGRGILRFDYKDLKISIEKNKEVKGTANKAEYKKNRFFSFIANQAIISNNFPGSKNYNATGIMIFDRTKNKPIFDLYWNSLQTGLMDILIPNAFYNTETHYNKSKNPKKTNPHIKTKKTKKVKNK
jgi:hypothetical protein